MRKNLLIGAITNYIWDDIAPFFNSYKQAGFEDCDCVMFTGNMSEQTLDKLRACGVEVLPIPEEYLSGRIVLYRFKLFEDFLDSRSGKYDMVLTVDIRDLIFQRDLFKLCDPSNPFLGVVFEDADLTEDFNRKLIEDNYGQEILQIIKHERIICMGTVWGTCREFTEFVRELSKELELCGKPYNVISDQCSANIMVYYRKKFADILKPSTNYDGYVMTIGITDANDIHTDSAGNVLNGKGEIAAVVHQYDRQPQIIHFVLKKYSEGMSSYAKISLKHNCDIIGRVMRFLSRIHRKGLVRAVSEAIKRRLH